MAAVHWWSLELELVHLVVLSSEADWTNGSAQHAWLTADLARVNRSSTPFVVLATHRPFYSSGPSCQILPLGLCNAHSLNPTGQIKGNSIALL